MKSIRLLLLVFVSILFSSCEEIQDLKLIGVDSFFVNKINTEGIDADVKLKVQNPNKMSFTIYPSEFEIIMSGIRLGKAKLSKRVHIDGNSERVYTFNLKTQLGDLNLFDAIKLLNPGNLGKIEIRGDLKAGKFFMKKKFPINYSDRIKILK